MKALYCSGFTITYILVDIPDVDVKMQHSYTNAYLNENTLNQCTSAWREHKTSQFTEQPWVTQVVHKGIKREWKDKPDIKPAIMINVTE